MDCELSSFIDNQVGSLDILNESIIEEDPKEIDD
jgi:hypothetical protein